MKIILVNILLLFCSLPLIADLGCKSALDTSPTKSIASLKSALKTFIQTEYSKQKQEGTLDQSSIFKANGESVFDFSKLSKGENSQYLIRVKNHEVLAMTLLSDFLVHHEIIHEELRFFGVTAFHLK